MLEVLSRSGQLLQIFHFTSCHFVQFPKALLESCDGWMSQAVEDGQESAEIVQPVEVLGRGREGGGGREGEGGGGGRKLG